MTTTGTLPVTLDHILNIPIEHLVESPTNPRKFYDERSLKELANSIREGGIHQPLIVREHARDGRGGYVKIVGQDWQLYELVTGHRRLRAAKLAGLDNVPCLVRAIGDNEIREIQVIENLQREDVHPLDEADSYQELMQQYGTAQLVAARVGKPIEYVTRRLKLVDLIPLARTAFSARLFTIDHALLLAKLGTEEQEQALRYTIDRGAGVKTKTEDIVAAGIESAKDGYWEPSSVPNLREHIECELRLELKKAPWDLADANLVVSAGPCTTCPSNTAANTALFSDLAIDTATCTDAACFSAKRKAFVELKVEATKAASTKEDLVVVQISHKHSSAKPRTAKPPKHNKAKDGGCNAPCQGCAFESHPTEVDLGQVFKEGQWVEAKKGECEHVIAGVLVDFDDSYGSGAKAKPGTKKLICVTPKCKAHKKDYEKPAGSRGGSSRYDPAEEERKREKAREKAETETTLRSEQVVAAMKKVSKVTPPIAKHFMEWFVGQYSFDNILAAAMGEGWKKKLLAGGISSPQFAQAAVVFLVADNVRASEWNTERHAADRAELFKDLKELTGYDAAAALKTAEKAKAAPAGKKGSKK